MAAFVIGPLAKMIAAAGAWLLFKPRSTEATTERPAALDTTALDELATSSPATSTVPATAQGSSTSVPVGAQGSSSTPPLSESERASLLGDQGAAGASSPASSTPSVPAHWVPVSASTPAVETSSASIPVDTDGTPSPVVDDESARSAARALHAYILRTPASRRDRVYVRSLQAAMGGVTVDGLIGRQTAARIRALTGLRIPGLS